VQVSQRVVKIVSPHATIINEQLEEASDQVAKLGGHHVPKCGRCTGEPKWHSLVAKVPPTLDIETDVGLVLLPDGTCVEAGGKVECVDPSVPAEVLLLRSNITLRDWHNFCDVVQRFEALADAPFLFCRWAS
jgi:hypothetical protein